MFIFWRLILAYLLAEYTFQTEHIARWKQKSMWGGAAHSAMFLASGIALCGGYLGSSWHILGGNIQLPGWSALTLLAFLHFLQDEWRVRMVRSAGGRDTLFFFLWDLLVHLSLIYAFFPRQYASVPEKWVLLISLLILTTQFIPVLVYFLEKEILGAADGSRKGRYYGMVEHLVTAMIIFQPGSWALMLLALWLTRIAMRRIWFEQNTSWLSIISGNSLALLFGLIARGVYWH